MSLSKSAGWRVGLAVAALALPQALFAADFHWQGRLAPGRVLQVYGVNGGIHASSAAGDEATVEAVKKAKRSDPESVEIKVIEHAEGVTICAVYPGREGEANDCQPGGKGRMNVRDNDVSVEFTVQVPAGVRFVAKTVNGGIEAKGLSGDVDANTVNGGVSVDTAGEAHAQTVNGGITAALGRADGKGPLKFSTVNGGITVDLPASIGAEVKAQTVNGAIQTDFGLTVTGGVVGKKLQGTIGGGGRSLELNTVNGSIQVRKR
jgi:hypothetical protein